MGRIHGEYMVNLQDFGELWDREPSKMKTWYKSRWIALGSQPSAAVSEWVSEWVGGWVGEWVSEWVSEWGSQEAWSTMIGMRSNNSTNLLSSDIYQMAADRKNPFALLRRWPEPPGKPRNSMTSPDFHLNLKLDPTPEMQKWESMHLYSCVYNM